MARSQSSIENGAGERGAKGRAQCALQPLQIPPKPDESAYVRRRLYELTMSRSFNKVSGGSGEQAACSANLVVCISRLHQFVYAFCAVERGRREQIPLLARIDDRFGCHKHSFSC